MTSYYQFVLFSTAILFEQPNFDNVFDNRVKIHHL